MNHEAKRTLSAFLQISLDGYYSDSQGDISFAHKSPDDREWQQFTNENAASGNMLVFGRHTYEMMAAWWPTPAAAAAMPEVAAGMNQVPKLVFSRSLKDATWHNSTVIADDPATTMRRLKREPGPDMTILGSGSIVEQLAGAGLIDTLQIAICPIALGTGKALFAGIAGLLQFTLTQSRTFANGSVVLCYSPRNA